MKAVTLTAPTYMELRSLFLVRKLYVPPDTKLSPAQYSELCKRFTKGYERLKNLEETKDMMYKINKYIVELDSLGINDHEVQRIQFTYGWVVRKMILSVIYFHICLLISLPGLVILSPFGFFIKRKAEEERIKVLK